MILYAIKSTVPPPLSFDDQLDPSKKGGDPYASQTTKLSPIFKLFGWIALSVYTAAASGSEISFRFLALPMPALSAACSVAFFAESLQTAGTVRTHSTFVVFINCSPYLFVKVSRVWLYSIVK